MSDDTPNADAPSEAENLARMFHETYERLAPSFGYETRKDSAKPWSEVPDKNKRLMIAVCGEILRQHTAAVAAATRELREENQHLRSLMENAARSINHLGELANVNPELYRTIKATAQALLDAARKAAP